MAARRVPAVVTAGGRLTGDLARAAGTTVKALAPLGDRPLLAHVLGALGESGRVGTVAVVGPRADLAGVLAGADPDRHLLVDEGATGPENIFRGFAALREAAAHAGDDPVLLSATDVPFLTGATVSALLDAVAAEAADADIVFPILTRRDYERHFPGAPNVYAYLRDGAFTGGSVQVVRPAAIERNLPLIEKAFDARKSQVQMAKLLGLPFIFRFLTRQLGVAEAEAQASRLTGCRCRALVFEDARIAADIDGTRDYDFARDVWEARERERRGNGRD